MKPPNRFEVKTKPEIEVKDGGEKKFKFLVRKPSIIELDGEEEERQRKIRRANKQMRSKITEKKEELQLIESGKLKPKKLKVSEIVA